MKKLKLDSIEVTSFETSAGETREFGTVLGRDGKPAPITTFCQPTTPDMDCTYGCSRDTSCAEACVGLLTVDPGCAFP
ncbi:MAG TPA: pinensin family lanthipeptide [Longimicrobium sp.]|nr:pinensin family lanthipeptide [Longimicrobium sp.]